MTACGTIEWLLAHPVVVGIAWVALAIVYRLVVIRAYPWRQP